MRDHSGRANPTRFQFRDGTFQSFTKSKISLNTQNVVTTLHIHKHKLHTSLTAPMKWLRVNIQEHKSQFNAINNNIRLTCRVSESREADYGSVAGIKVTDPVTDQVLRVTSGSPSSSPKSIFTKIVRHSHDVFSNMRSSFRDEKLTATD